MSKFIASLPKGLVKNGVIGAVIALLVYVLLQFVSALLLHSELVGEGMLYPMVCVSAAVSSFAGCGCSALRGKNGSVLSAYAVVLIFLTLTVAVALLTGGAEPIGAGLTGVGIAMAIGGLLGAVVVGAAANRQGRKRNNGGRRRLKTETRRRS